MKSIIVTIAILLFGVTSAYAQDTTNRSVAIQGNPVDIMRDLAGMKSQFIGKPLSTFLKKYESHLPIEFMGIVETSPWIHPQGKSYVSGIIISYQDEMSRLEDDAKEGGHWNLLIKFQDPHMDYFTFWEQFPASMTEQQQADHIGNLYYIKDITLYKINKH